MKKYCVMLIMVLLNFTLFSDFQEIIEKSDLYFWNNQNLASYEIVAEAWSKDLSKKEQFELAWRITRGWVIVTDELATTKQLSKRDILANYQKGIDWGEKSIELNKQSAIGYYWKAASYGRYGQTKGIFDSLDKAYLMIDLLKKGVNLDEDFADGFFLIGQLYYEVPKFFFGDKSWAISATRLAIDKYSSQKPFYIYNAPEYNSYYFVKLVSYLESRNWSAEKRVSQMKALKLEYKNSLDNYEKSKYFEANLDFSLIPEYADISLSNMSDKEEAVAISKFMLRWIEEQESVEYLEEHKQFYNDIIKKHS